MGFLDSFEAAIFDLDGTLIDSMPLWDRLCSDWLVSLNKIPEAGLETDIAVMTVSQSADYVNSHYALAISKEELIAQWEEIMMERYLKAAPLKQGVRELLQALAERMSLGVATYSFPRPCEAILQHHKIRSYFSSILYAHEFELVSQFSSVKKDPLFWRTAAAQLGVIPEKCIVFEDSFSSLEGVHAAGMSLAAVFDPSCSNWPDLSKAADLVLNYPGEALNYS